MSNVLLNVKCTHLWRCTVLFFRVYDNDVPMPGPSDGVPIVLITTQEDGEDDNSGDEWLDILPVSDV